MLRFVGYILFTVSDSMVLLEHSDIQLPYLSYLIYSLYYISQYIILLAATQSNNRLLTKLELNNSGKEAIILAGSN